MKRKPYGERTQPIATIKRGWCESIGAITHRLPLLGSIQAVNTDSTQGFTLLGPAGNSQNTQRVSTGTESCLFIRLQSGVKIPLNLFRF